MANEQPISGAGLTGSADAGNPGAGAAGAGTQGSGAGAGAGLNGSADAGNPNDWAKAKGWLNDDGSFKTEELAKGYRSLEEQAGRMVALPDDKAKPEDRDAFFKKLGWPGDPKGFDLKKPEDFKLPYDEKLRDRWAGKFNDARLTPAQAQLIHDEALKMQQEDVAAFETAINDRAKAAQPVYVKEWGPVGSEGFNKMNQAAQTALKDPKLAGMEDWMKTNGLLTREGLFTEFWVGHLLAERGKSLLNDRMSNPAGGVGDMKGNPFQRRLADGKENPDFNMTVGAQLKKSDPERARALWVQAGLDPKAFDVT